MIWASLSLHLPFQIAECIDSAKGVVKYFKNKTVVHGLLGKARKHVKVSPMLLQSSVLKCTCLAA